MKTGSFPSEVVMSVPHVLRRLLLLLKCLFYLPQTSSASIITLFGKAKITVLRL